MSGSVNVPYHILSDFCSKRRTIIRCECKPVKQEQVGPVLGLMSAGQTGTAALESGNVSAAVCDATLIAPQVLKVHCGLFSMNR
jgi:hypothetical protein